MRKGVAKQMNAIELICIRLEDKMLTCTAHYHKLELVSGEVLYCTLAEIDHHGIFGQLTYLDIKFNHSLSHGSIQALDILRLFE